MTKRRSKLEICLQILRLAENEIAPTRLMYGSNMSWNTCNKYVATLVENNLLLEIDKTKQGASRRKVIYKTSPAGLELMEQLDNCVLLTW